MAGCGLDVPDLQQFFSRGACTRTVEGGGKASAEKARFGIAAALNMVTAGVIPANAGRCAYSFLAKPVLCKDRGRRRICRPDSRRIDCTSAHLQGCPRSNRTRRRIQRKWLFCFRDQPSSFLRFCAFRSLAVAPGLTFSAKPPP